MRAGAGRTPKVGRVWPSRCPAYRSASGFTPRGTLAELLTFTGEEQGNKDIQAQGMATARRLGVNPSRVAARLAVWVSHRRAVANGYNDGNAEPWDVADGRVLAEDGDGGWLVLVAS